MEKELTLYIREKHTQEECIGFIDGFNEAKKVLYTKEEVMQLVRKAFEAGYKKYEVVEAGFEGLETDAECNWILKKYGKND